jgi:hypothetical protein
MQFANLFPQHFYTYRTHGCPYPNDGLSLPYPIVGFQGSTKNRKVFADQITMKYHETDGQFVSIQLVAGAMCPS